MQFLTILAYFNCVCIILFFLSGQRTRMTYTEIMIIRKVGAYVFTFLAFLVISFWAIGYIYIVKLIALVFNAILSVVLIIYFLKRLLRLQN